MQRGDLVGGRFEVRRAAGSGGMSVVYRALDQQTGERVAVKILRRNDDLNMFARFAREADVLSKLSHDGIVKYVAHGKTRTGAQFLAMEWLEGEDLARRLRRTMLTIPECLTLVRTVAEALACAHGHGIIHQDIKPGNLFLPRGRVDEVKVLDFGAARVGRSETDAILAGSPMGTPAYMSPEQARGASELDPRTDVFALGCVLFQCLTQRRPFFGSDPIAILAKILLEEPPRPSKLADRIPERLDQLVMRMLAKDPSDRPADGNAVVAALDALGPISDHDDQPSSGGRALTEEERSLHSVVMAKGVDSQLKAGALTKIVEDHGGHVELLTDDSFVVAISGTDAATDLASRAARCALAVRSILPESSLALATGRELLTSHRGSVGSLIDRATRLLRAVEPAGATQETREMSLTVSDQLSQANRRSRRAESPAVPVAVAAPSAHHAGEIHLDDVTAGLLDSRFVVTDNVIGAQLNAERPHNEGVRTLLAKPTPCVGREAELGTLMALFYVCASEPESCIVRITAGVGVGKSRLRHELLRRLEERQTEFQLLIGFADPLSAGAPFGSLGAAIRRAAHVLDGEPVEVQREKLRARIGNSLSRDVEQVSAFIGEMVGVPFPDDNNVQLRAARHDPLLMRDQIRRAWETAIAAECARTPTIIVLEDLHWGDLPTVELIDSTLVALQDAPLMVIALARPEIDSLFPNLWAERGVHHIHLGALSSRASRKLAREVLGDETPTEAIADIVERAAGNAFYLEELIRASVEGDTLQSPETVLAMVQARLERLDGDARRVLRAASVYGRRFWQGGLRTMVGEEHAADHLDKQLGLLVDREVIKLVPSGKFPGETEYRFRHDIIRDAAYAMLTDSDLETGHALAADWLDRVGESEAVLLAEHYERGGKPQHAVGFYRRAAEQSMLANDFAAVFARAERGVRCGGSGEELGALRLLQAEALNWQGDFREASSSGNEAMRFLEREGSLWYAALGEIANASGVQGDGDQLRDLCNLLGSLEGHADLDARIWAATRLAEQLLITGDIEHADRILSLIEERARGFDERHPGIAARVRSANAMRSRFDGNTGAGLDHVTHAAHYFARAGDLRNAWTERERAGYGKMKLGAYAEAEDMLRKAASAARDLGLQNVVATARHNLGLTLSRLGKVEEAARLELAAADAFRASGNRRLEGAARTYLALIYMDAGDHATAERHARLALKLAERPTLMPLNRAQTLGVLARTLVHQDRGTEALRIAREGLDMLEELGGIDEGESQIRLSYAEALHVAGEVDAAREAIVAAANRVRQRADRITNPRWRKSFLLSVPEHARTFELERAWSGRR